MDHSRGPLPVIADPRRQQRDWRNLLLCVLAGLAGAVATIVLRRLGG